MSATAPPDVDTGSGSACCVYAAFAKSGFQVRRWKRSVECKWPFVVLMLASWLGVRPVLTAALCARPRAHIVW